MSASLVAAALALTIGSAGAHSAIAGDACGVSALVTRVFDGDTIDVAGVGRVRLLGIDAPEMGGRFERPAPFAIEARERLQTLVLHRWVRLECDGPRRRDEYGRSLAYVFLGTRELVNAQLVRDGVARVSVRTRLKYWEELRRAEEEARARRRGMWGERPRVLSDPGQPVSRWS